jgi:hypothetical protein
MRLIALLSISIALAACPGCATLGHAEAEGRQGTDSDTLPASRLDLSRALHGLSDWAER